MDLNTLWFGIIAFMFIGFFFLEGFDFGIGMLMPFLGKNDVDRRLIISAIGPFWDGNEVWLITAGGAMLAAFPHWYASMFSGFYLGMVLLLVALIVRGVGFEFRNRRTSRTWHTFWDWMIFTGSLVPALFWGIAFTNLIKGVAIDGNKHVTGSILDLLNPYALLGGVVFAALFLVHGAIFLSLKSEGKIMVRANRAANLLWLPAAVLLAVFVIASNFATDMFSRGSALPVITAVAAAGAMLAVAAFVRVRRYGWAFAMTGLTIIMATLTIFTGLFPRVMVSSLKPEWSLTIDNAASSSYSLGITSMLALGLIPVIIAYQIWNYWIFRQRVSHHNSAHL